MRLTLWCFLVFALIISAAEYVVFISLKDVMEDEMETALLSRAVAEVAGLQNTPQINEAVVDQIEDRTFSDARFVIQMVQVEDQRGSVVAQSKQLGTNEPLLTAKQLQDVLNGRELITRSWRNGRALRVAALAAPKVATKYAIAVAVPTNALDHSKRRVAGTLILVGVLMVAAASWGGYKIIDRALAPVDQITQRAHKIGQGDLSQRIPVGDAGAEIVQLAEMLNDMLDKLERLFENQKRFTADASHEIRSPLTALRCKLEVAVRQPRTAQQYQEVIKSSLKEVVRLSALADDLLLLARADAGHLHLEFREVCLSHVLQDICSEMSELAAGAGVQVSLQADTPRAVYADRVQLERVFRNLVQNGIKYSKDSGRGLVSIHILEDGPWVRVDVEDHGIGIAESELDHIFDRFYRSDHAHPAETEGTGLGLAICQQIIKAHRGRIEVSSRLGLGSTFSTFLPDAAKITSEEEETVTDLVALA
jgi:two-component system OmpR family sensor kinase